MNNDRFQCAVLRFVLGPVAVYHGPPRRLHSGADRASLGFYLLGLGWMVRNRLAVDTSRFIHQAGEWPKGIGATGWSVVGMREVSIHG